MNAVLRLIDYAAEKELIADCERIWAVNAALDALRADSLPEVDVPEDAPLHIVLDALCDDAFARGALGENTVTCRDLFDTELMGRLTPRPAQVIEKFEALRAEDAGKATDWYYRFSQDTNYIRRDRSAKDVRWKAPTAYGELDITINLAKPEKDPRAIAAARELPASDYPAASSARKTRATRGASTTPRGKTTALCRSRSTASPGFCSIRPMSITTSIASASTASTRR